MLSCFRILIELVVDTESVLFNSDCKIFLFFDKLTGSECTFVSGKTALALIHLVCYILMQKNQLPSCGILIARGLHHHSIYK